MAKEKNAARGQYGEVVSRLQQIVESLEGGELSLEESLEKFEQGIGLVKQAEGILGDAEKRIEQLLSDDGRAVPLKIAENVSAEPPRAAAPTKKPMTTPTPAPAVDLEDDVPF